MQDNEVTFSHYAGSNETNPDGSPIEPCSEVFNVKLDNGRTEKAEGYWLIQQGYLADPLVTHLVKQDHN